MLKHLFSLCLCCCALFAPAQSFYFGADLSYVNEMEDCGVVYKEAGAPKDPYRIFADHHCNLVRLRLWHTPSWYDTLNAGKRYSDLKDVRKSIARAKALGMNVLLDFHLSDTWADPGRQLVPSAWLGVVNNLPLLKDSLYNYVHGVLTQLAADNLLPDMVQIGNETNRGIMLAPAVDAAGWSLDWTRNSQLFKKAIQAVRDVEQESGKPIQVALHIAGPADAWWLMEGFWSHGVTDFDVIGLSYYWAWHKPTSIEDAGNVVAELRQKYPGKDVMIFETGYIWTNQWNDNASNIITEVHLDYAPASPQNQRLWLIEMTQEVINRGAKGVCYWEPAWQSSGCWTPWGQGSHQEHATYFDFQNNLLANGGMGFMEYPYANLSAAPEPKVNFPHFRVWPDSSRRQLMFNLEGFERYKQVMVRIFNSGGKMVLEQPTELLSVTSLQLSIPELPSGLYYVGMFEGERCLASRGVALGGGK